MNSFGRLFRVSIFGESHGQGVGIVIDGSPAGIPLHPEDFLKDLKRRLPGTPGTTSRQEPDYPEIKSGVLENRTTGAPILIYFRNTDCRAEDYEEQKNLPRPGHADLVAFYKFGGFNDFRGGGHFSGRLTVALVAAGVVAKKIISPAQVEAELLEAGGSRDIQKVIDRAIEEKDSVGGIVECRAKPLPPGLGEPFFDSVESLISHLVFAIPGIKGVEFGDGFACSQMKGSECNDPIISKAGKTLTNHAGGINGGITNGNELVVRAAVKPTPSIPRPQRTMNLRTGEEKVLRLSGRHDTCIALRVPVVLEAAVAIVLADLMLIAQKIPLVWRKI